MDMAATEVTVVMEDMPAADTVAEATAADTVVAVIDLTSPKVGSAEVSFPCSKRSAPRTLLVEFCFKLLSEAL
jgi:hypothetical protein